MRGGGALRYGAMAKAWWGAGKVAANVAVCKGPGLPWLNSRHV